MKETEKNSQRHIDTNFLKRIPGSSNVTLHYVSHSAGLRTMAGPAGKGDWEKKSLFRGALCSAKFLSLWKKGDSRYLATASRLGHCY